MAENKTEAQAVLHNIIIENRSKLILSGINEVESFEEDNVRLKTTKGDLTIRGNDMKMESYQSEIGDLVMRGDVYALVYTNDTGAKEGFFSRIFK